MRPVMVMMRMCMMRRVIAMRLVSAVGVDAIGADAVDADSAAHDGGDRCRYMHAVRVSRHWLCLHSLRFDSSAGSDRCGSVRSRTRVVVVAALLRLLLLFAGWILCLLGFTIIVLRRLRFLSFDAAGVGGCFSGATSPCSRRRCCCSGTALCRRALVFDNVYIRHWQRLVNGSGWRGAGLGAGKERSTVVVVVVVHRLATQRRHVVIATARLRLLSTMNENITYYRTRANAQCTRASHLKIYTQRNKVKHTIFSF